MQVECLILDLDDTLCDYQSAKKKARMRVERELARYHIDGEAFWAALEDAESRLVKQLSDAAISWQQYRERRFRDALGTMHDNPGALSRRLDDMFSQEVNATIALFDDVLPVIAGLGASGITPALLTNGFADVQRRKIRTLALDEYISHIYISEELGVSKPHRLIFDLVLKDLGTDASKVLMIGDSIELDLAGARQADIPFVLIDRYDQHPDFEHDRIRRLTDLYEIMPLTKV